MTQLTFLFRSAMSLAIAFALAGTTAAQLELTTNGDFETGDVSGWDYFPQNPNGFFGPTNDANSGTTAGFVDNPGGGPFAEVIKQSNLGAGILTVGSSVNVSFSAKGFGANGGVVFAEFFTELAGGGTSSSQFLGGGPLNLDPNNYQDFSFDIDLLTDVSGGVSLQFAVVTGAGPGSVQNFFVDDVSVSTAAIPEPTSALLLGMGGLGLVLRRRRSA